LIGAIGVCLVQCGSIQFTEIFESFASKLITLVDSDSLDVDVILNFDISEVLASYPGPFLAKITDWHLAYFVWQGDGNVEILRLHHRYGKSSFISLRKE
jgi:hypothetical protein